MIHDNATQHEPTSTQSAIRVGACGWDHTHWQGSFYPDDLPEDWRLAYYANEFSAVLLDESSWRSAEIDLENCAEEVGDNFRFYLQHTSTPAESVERERIKIQQQLGDHFGGFVDLDASGFDQNSAVAVISPGSKDLRGWRQWLQVQQQKKTPLQAIFLSEPSLSYQSLSDFKSLLELLNL